MQQLLISWMLVGMLLLPADQAGLIQASIGVASILVMLWGGVVADRFDPRTLLIRVYSIAWLVPLILIGCLWSGLFNLWVVMLFGLGISVVTAYTSPALQAILNRVSGDNLQRGVTSATATGFVVQVIALALAARMEVIGLITILTVQSVCLACAAVTIRLVSAQPGSNRPDGPAGALIRDGFRAVFRTRIIFHILCINFVSMIFNAGAFNIILPYIVKRIYDGDAAQLGLMMIVFYSGAAISNFAMLRLMPLLHPGKVYLLMQLSRAVVVLLIWTSPGETLLTALLFLWGLNMGVTTTLARSIVQESAEEEYLGRILSVFNLGTLCALPIGVMLLGIVIESFGTLTALLPSAAVSVILFLVGVFATKIWAYRSPHKTLRNN
jgi:MFS family permease